MAEMPRDGEERRCNGCWAISCCDLDTIMACSWKGVYRKGQKWNDKLNIYIHVVKSPWVTYLTRILRNTSAEVKRPQRVDGSKVDGSSPKSVPRSQPYSQSWINNTTAVTQDPQGS